MEKNRKSYDNPLIELLLFSDADVITTSGETPTYIPGQFETEDVPFVGV